MVHQAQTVISTLVEDNYELTTVHPKQGFRLCGYMLNASAWAFGRPNTNSLHSYNQELPFLLSYIDGWSMSERSDSSSVIVPSQTRGRDADCPPHIQLFRDETYAAAATRVWRSVSSDLRKAYFSYSQFRRSLKTFLFEQPEHDALWMLLTVPNRNICTYLLSYF